MKKIIKFLGHKHLLAALFSFITVCSFSQATTCISINTSIDDVEEEPNAGNIIDDVSLDLDLGENGAKIVGLRFNNVNVPQGALITNAYIQFTAEEVGTVATSLTIEGEATDNAPPFTLNSYDVSSRTNTSASVNWAPPAWNTIGSAGAGEKSPDITNIIDEIVSRPGYVQGNSIALIVTGNGKRGAYPYDASPAQAPELCITYCNDVDNDGVCDNIINATPTSKIIINEVNYRSIEIQQNIEFIELYNNDAAPVDLTGWHLTKGISYEFPAGTIMNPGDYLVICADPTVCQSEFGITGVLGPYSGGLSGKGDEIILRDNFFKIHDKVDYEGWKEWPNVRYNDYTTQLYDAATATYYDEKTKVSTSIQKINPELPGKHAGSWSADIPTPDAQNSNIYKANWADIPVVKSISKSPDKPVSNDVVRIKADMTNIDNIAGSLSLALEYQTVDAGNYIHKSDSNYNSNWQSIPMYDNGVGADSTANNGIYTAAIPASVQQHRKLVRYRVKVSSPAHDAIYPDQNHTESNYSYYVYDGYPLVNGTYDIAKVNPMQEITVITGSSTSATYMGPGDGINNTGQYTGYEYLGEGTIVYNGKVYDHIRFRPRGRTTGRAARTKPGVKFDLNSERGITPQDDCGEEYDEERGKLTLSGTYVNDITTHGMTESVIHKVLQLTGAKGRDVDYTQLRVVDKTTETGAGGDFWGVFLILENYDGDFLNEHDLPDGNIWRYKRSGLNPHRMTHQGDFPNTNSIGPWTQNVADADIDHLIADKVANLFLGQGANNYEGKHAQRDYYNSETGKWSLWYGDYDTTFGMSFDDGTFFPRSDSDPNTSVLLVQDMTGIKIEYKNAMRSAYDLLFNQEQADFLIDMESKKIHNPSAAYDWTDLDHSRWNQTYDLGNVGAQIDWYKQWFTNRSQFLLTNSTDGFYDGLIPGKPTITHTGTNALDDLTFNNSSFTDPNGNFTFAALEWRVGEWSDPANPIYVGICKPKYEMETKWRSGEITSFSNTYTIPADAQLKTDRTYKVRVRYKDNTGRWSHWSDPVQIVPTPATPSNYDLVINEIMYNDGDDCCGDEYVEIYNAGSSSVSLDNFKFTEGIDYDFPQGMSMAADSYIVLAKDSVLFVQKYGYSPFGDYGGTLSNGSEDIVLEAPYRIVVDTVRYFDDGAWDENPDGSGTSLELLDPLSDNADPANWFRSDVLCGTPSAPNSRVCTGTTESIVINEINYNGPNSPDAGDWVELHNATANAIDISDWEFYDGGNQFIIPQGTLIQPDGFLILTENDTLFTAIFPHVTDYIGNLDFGFSNGGERISLFDENKCLSDYVAYDDNMPWDTIPDGNGPTLSLITPNSDNTLPPSWEPSSNINSAYGTPGRANEPCLVQQIVAPDTVCVGLPATLTVDILDSDVTYTWSAFGSSLSSVNRDSTEAMWTTPGTYTIQLFTSYFECTKIYNKQVVVKTCNTGPALIVDNYTVPEDNVLNNGVSVLANDGADPEGHTLTVVAVSSFAPSNGSVVINPNGTFIYTPNPDFNGTDSFEYEVCDNGSPVICNTQLVHIDVIPVNDAPIAVDDTPGTPEDAPLNGLVHNNDSDIDGDSLTVTTTPVSPPSNGTLTLLANGSYTYTPNPDFNGTDSFEYEICDDGNPTMCDTAIVTIDISPVNDAPVATLDSLFTVMDTLLIDNVLQNDIDIDGDSLTVTNIITNPANGTASIQPNGDISFQPNPSFIGTDQLTYEVCDTGGLCDVTTVVLVVEPGCVDVQIYLYLEGPYDAGIAEMTTVLSTVRKLLPGQTPTSNLATPTPAGQPYSIAPWNYTGTEGAGWTDVDYTGDEVDWILVSFRTGTGKTTEVAQTAALLNKDGSVRFPDRCALLASAADSVYVVVEHRNHMGIMSPTPIEVVNGVLVHDFRTTDGYKDPTSFGQKQLSTGDWAMYTGDSDQAADLVSYDITGIDKTVWFDNNGVFDIYMEPDFNLDGDINGQDKSLWYDNNGIASRVPKQ